MTMIVVIYGYARVSKANDESMNLDTQLLLLAEHGIRPDLVYSDVASGRNLQSRLAGADEPGPRGRHHRGSLP